MVILTLLELVLILCIGATLVLYGRMTIKDETLKEKKFK